MRIGIVSNRASGRGKAAALADRAATGLRAAGYEVVPIGLAELDRVGDLDILIAAGGDGTVRAVIPALLRTGAALYQLPVGTENLFSREFGMTVQLELMMKAVARGRTRPIDVAFADGTPFMIMLSVGPDAGVIHRVHAARTGAITHLSYLKPVAQEIFSPSLPVLSATVDGRELVREEQGILVVANCRQYGFRLDPALNARMDDGLLDVVFLPARSSLAGLVWMARARFRRHLRHGALRCRTGSRIEIAGESAPLRYQVDGEAGIASTGSITIEVRPGAVRVLVP